MRLKLNRFVIFIFVSAGFLTGSPLYGSDPGDATIYEIQQGEYAQFTFVTVTGPIVTGAVDGQFWIGEPGGGAWSGIWVNPGDVPLPVRGDEVTVSGYYYEDSGLSIINAPTTIGGSFSVVGGGNPEPVPSAVAVGDINTGSANAEQWEGTLVTLDSVRCIDSQADHWLAVEFDGDSPGETLRVDQMFTYNVPAAGESLETLTGLVHYLSGEFRLVPRDNYDVIVPDGVAPAAITDFAASTGEYNGEVNFSWTATGDDGGTGTASSYIIRYSASPIDDGNWASAADVTGEPVPQPSGAFEFWTGRGLTAGETLYFAIRAADESNNESPTSNTVQAEVNGSVPKLTIHCIDIGQGDCTLIQSGTGKTFLFDAGWNGIGTTVVVPYLQALGIDTLTWMGASHYDADHIGGLDDVIGAIPVEQECWDRGWSYTTATYFDYVAAAGAHRTAITDGTVLDMGDGVQIRCVCVNGNGLLSPPFDDTYAENDLSIGLVVEVGFFQFFVGGDISGYPECNPYHDIESSVGAEVGDIEVLRTDHHGSHCNTNTNLLDSMTPEAAIISVGDSNPYGHPHQTMLNRLRSRDIYIYQTEQGSGGTFNPGEGEIAGDIVIQTNGYASFIIEDSVYVIEEGVGVDVAGDAVPAGPALLTAAPNPFNAFTTIRFYLTDPGPARLEIYDVSGRLVRVLADGYHAADLFTSHWDGYDRNGSQAASGIYFARLEAGGQSFTQKMVLLR